MIWHLDVLHLCCLLCTKFEKCSPFTKVCSHHQFCLQAVWKNTSCFLWCVTCFQHCKVSLSTSYFILPKFESFTAISQEVRDDEGQFMTKLVLTIIAISCGFLCIGCKSVSDNFMTDAPVSAQTSL